MKSQKIVIVAKFALGRRPQDGVDPKVMASLLYGTGLRLMEYVRLKEKGEILYSQGYRTAW
jgi:site-specific recombinase XerD